MIRYKYITILVLLLGFLCELQASASVAANKSDSISEAIKHADPSEKAALYNELAILSKEDAALSIKYADSALFFAREYGIRNEMALALKTKGYGLEKLGDSDSAIALLNQSLLLYNEQNNLEIAANILNNIGIIYSDRSDFQQSIDYHQRGLKIEQGLNDSNDISLACFNIAVTYDFWEKYDSAIVYFSRVLKFAELLDDSELEATAQNSLGNIYLSWGNYHLALQYFLRSLEIFETSGDSLGISQALNNLGIIQLDFGDHEKSLDFFKRSYVVDSIRKDRAGQAQTLNNIAIIYDELGKKEQALSAYLQSLEYATQSKDYYQMAISSGNVGVFYLDQGDYNIAEKYFDHTYKFYQAANSVIGIAETNILKGELYYNKADYELALKYYKMGLDVVLPMDLTEVILNAYSGMEAVHFAMGDYKEAYEINDKYHTLKDSIYSLKISKQLALTQQGYEIQKKDQEMQLQDIKLKEQKARIQRQKTLVILLFCTVGIVLIFTILLIRQYHLRMKAWKQLLRQHDEILKNRQELIRAKEKAEESDRLKTSFLKNFSHEIRTPMNGIIGFTDLLQKGNFTQEERSSYLKYIESSGHQLLKVVNDIIDMASLEAGQVVLSEDNFNLHELFSKLLLEQRSELSGSKNKTVKLIYTPAEGLDELSIRTDKKRLHQVISNLIANALGFTEKGHVIFGFRLLDEKTIEIRVEDTGIGLERSRFEMIFDRFRQVDDSSSRQQGGSGLGLSICKELLSLMGGRIYLESTLGKGSTFFVELPFTPAGKI